jgi:hypothetical protein
MVFLVIAMTISSLVAAPFLASRVMGISGGIGKSALVAFVQLGLSQIIGMISGFLGPMGGLVGFMAILAAWFQVVKVVYGTKTEETIVFMFWHLFFILLLLSLLALLLDPNPSWAWFF